MKYDYGETNFGWVGGHSDDVQGLNQSWIMSAFLHGWESGNCIRWRFGGQGLLDLEHNGWSSGWVHLAGLILIEWRSDRRLPGWLASFTYSRRMCVYYEERGLR